ncbi:MAG: HEPN domain-containing protein [Actinomycetota bacterium]
MSTPPDALPDSGPHEWLRRAKGNLARAKQPKPEEGFWEDLCFDAQQAAEKAVKAVLLFGEIAFPFVHDLGELLTLAARGGVDVPQDLWEADQLSEFAVVTRYPGGRVPVDEDEYRRAVALAEHVVRWAERVIGA